MPRHTMSACSWSTLEPARWPQQHQACQAPPPVPALLFHAALLFSTGGTQPAPPAGALGS